MDSNKKFKKKISAIAVLKKLNFSAFMTLNKRIQISAGPVKPIINQS